MMLSIIFSTSQVVRFLLETYFSCPKLFLKIFSTKLKVIHGKPLSLHCTMGNFEINKKSAKKLILAIIGSAKFWPYSDDFWNCNCKQIFFYKYFWFKMTHYALILLTVGQKTLKSPGQKNSWNQINQFHDFFFI